MVNVCLETVSSKFTRFPLIYLTWSLAVFPSLRRLRYFRSKIPISKFLFNVSFFYKGSIRDSLFLIRLVFDDDLCISIWVHRVDVDRNA